MLKSSILSLFLLLLFGCLSQNNEQTEPLSQSNQQARIKTVHGDIIIEFDLKNAPISSERIIHLTKNGFYNGLTFHKVIPNYIVQTGDPTGTGDGGSGQQIPFEETSIKHEEGAVSLARREDDKNSADSQFFICLQKDESLDGKYAAFGKVISGLEVLKKIAQGDKIITMSLE